MKKFINGRLFILAILFSIIAGLQMPFNTMTYSFIFYLIDKKQVSWIIPSIAVIIAGYALFSVFGYLQNVIINKNVYTINLKLKETYLTSQMTNVTADDNDFESSNLSFFMNDLKLLEDNYWRQLFSLLESIVMTIGTLAYALYSNVSITLVFLAFMVLPSVAPKLFSKSIQTRTSKWSKSNQTLSATVQNLLHGSLLLKRYKETTAFSDRLNKSVSDMEGSNANMKNQISLSNNVIGFLFDICSYLPIGLGIYFAITGRMTVAQFVAVQYSSAWILNGFNSMITGWNTINSTKEIRQKIEGLSQPNEPIQDKVAEVDDLSLEDVAFNYEKKNVFQHVSLLIHRGEKILIGGKSGIGKSTLIRMILKELKPAAGKILIDNQSYSQAAAYDTFGIVGQTPIIFEDSLRRNISLNPKADDQKVIEALKQAGLQEFANKDSLDMQISENGHNFSGGQLKRIEIARALYFNRQILLIDEGTASLDPETAADIHRSILNNPDLTVIEVDHHIPDDIKEIYNHTYELKETGLVTN